MNIKFQKIIEGFPKMLESLNDSPVITKDNFKNLPRAGIYVFFEHGKPQYVGRTNRMKNRLREHSQRSSGHMSATFAFNIAKKDPRISGVNFTQQRKIIEKDPTFSKIFTEAKERVSKMEVKIIEINDPIVQTLFEVYVALEFETNNVWENH